MFIFYKKTGKILKILVFLTIILGLFYFKTANAAVINVEVCIYDGGACIEWNGPIKFEVIGPFNRISKTPLFNRLPSESFSKILGTSSPSALNLPLTGGIYKFYQIHYVSGGPKKFSGRDVSLVRIRDLDHTTFSGRRIDEPCFRDSNVCDGVLAISNSYVKTIVFIFDIKNIEENTVAEGIVLGAAIQKPTKSKNKSELNSSECNYLLEYLKYGRKNNPLEMIKLQSFLKGFEGFKKVDINKKFDIPTLNAVHAFQRRYSDDILEPWALPGSTGYVYITTKKKINELYCQKEFPFTRAQKQEIKEYRALMLSLIQKQNKPK